MVEYGLACKVHGYVFLGWPINHCPFCEIAKRKNTQERKEKNVQTNDDRRNAKGDGS